MLWFLGYATVDYTVQSVRLFFISNFGHFLKNKSIKYFSLVRLKGEYVATEMFDLARTFENYSLSGKKKQKVMGWVRK